MTKEFTKQGYSVLATYRNESSAKDLLQFAKENSTVTTVTADVIDEKSFGQLKERLKEIKTLDILINNSGVIGDKSKSLSVLDISKVTETLKVNTLGPILVSKMALPFLAKNAKIAQITSLMGSISDCGGSHP